MHHARQIHAATQLLALAALDTCTCCTSLMDASEVATEDTHTIADTLAQHYGGPVCQNCADAHVECSECGQITDDFNGDYVCAECSYNADQGTQSWRMDNL